MVIWQELSCVRNLQDTLCYKNYNSWFNCFWQKDLWTSNKDDYSLEIWARCTKAQRGNRTYSWYISREFGQNVGRKTWRSIHKELRQTWDRNLFSSNDDVCGKTVNRKWIGICCRVKTSTNKQNYFSFYWLVFEYVSCFYLNMHTVWRSLSSADHLLHKGVIWRIKPLTIHQKHFSVSYLVFKISRQTIKFYGNDTVHR